MGGNGPSTRTVHSKETPQHWLPKLRKRSETAADYCVRIYFRGDQQWINLGTGNKTLAANRAVRFWIHLKATGSMAEAREVIGQPPAQVKTKVTISDWVEAYSAYADVDPRTISVYAGCLRRIAAGISGVAHENFPMRGDWREAADAIDISVLTKNNIERWMMSQLKGVDRERLPRRQASVHAALRNARNLFTKKIVDKVATIDLGTRPPFSDIDIKPWKSKRYLSTINVPLILTAARSELEPNLFRILILAGCVGLRKEEIDKLLWQQVHLDRKCISIEATWCYKPKSATSARVVPIADDVAEFLRDSMKDASGEFVIDGGHPRVGATYYHYRANKHFTALGKWLRTKGVTTTQPIHTFRKEFGSQINQIAGLKAASDLLGHSEIGITANTYVESRSEVVIPMTRREA